MGHARFPREIKIFFAAIGLTYIFAFAGSFLTPSFLETRYLAVFIGPWAMICGWMAAKILGGRSRTAFALLFVSALDVSQVLRSRRYYTEPKSEQNREAVEQAMRWNTPDRPIVLLLPGNDETMALYYAKRLKVPSEQAVPWLDSSREDEIRNVTAKDIAVISHGESWMETAKKNLAANYELIEDVPLYRVSVSHWKRKEK